ncbi:MAG: sugar ABC transporter substrate-binding protein [Micropruina sp.]|uniref:sugar ABC transporter substrate-binding protein n=1 Tax=Micropruina sp. TaxID=2737536 RepID=UPI0039E3DEB2
MSGTKRWKRASAALGAAALATSLLLTGCGRAETPSGGGATSSAASINDSPATGDLNVWAQADEAAALPKFAEEFMKANPGLKITVTALPWDAAHNKYQTAIASGTTPDMAQMGTTWMADFSDAFQTVPQGIDTSDFFEGSLNTNKVGDQLLGVPWYVDTRVIYYRTDLAQKAGWSQAPKTWDEFKQFLKDLKSKAGAKWGISLPNGGEADGFQSMLMFPWSNGANLTDEGQTKWTLDTPEFVSAMEYYKSLFTDGLADANPATGAGASESRFVSGDTPVLIAGPSGIGSISKAGGGDAYKSKFSVMRVPAQKSSTSFTGGSNLVVFKQAKNADAAWKFARWLSKPEIQVKWQKTIGDLPAKQSAWKDKSLADDPHLSVFGEQLADTKAPPALLTWTQVSAQADKALEQIVRGGKDPAAVMKDLQSQADSIGTGRR